MFNFHQTNNSLLDAIEKIYDNSKDSTLEQKIIEGSRDSIEHVMQFLGCSEEQAVIVSIMLQSQIEKGHFSIKCLLEHADLKTSSALYINELLIPLVEKEWICPKKDPKIYPLTDYQVNTKLVRSVLTGVMEIMESEKINTSFQLLARFQTKLNDRNQRRINYDQFIEWTHQFIHDHAQIDLANFIIDLKMKPADAAYFLYACLQHYNGNENCDFDNIMHEMVPSKEQQYNFRNAVKTGEHFLLKQGLLKESLKTDMFGGTTYRLTEKAIHAFDKNAVVKNKMDEGLLQHLKPETITEKKLIFDANEQQMVNKLHNMLLTDNYYRLTEKLEAQGMKKGISVLLYGHPGTGKTETVLQLGKNSQRFIMLADATKIRSKWVGETEKNMKSLFDEYRRALEEFEETPILLFNEADAILGKRHNVNDRGDQMENTMQNILLQELENFEGIFIATTNLVDNLDKAFDRRFLYKVRFGKPGANTVLQIWKSKFPEIKTSVLKNICSKLSLTGGQIENIRKKIAVDTLLDDKLKLNESYLMQLAEQELLLEKKNERRTIGFIQ